MIVETKKRKLRYKHTDQKRKAASGTHGFQLDSNTFRKSMNVTNHIIRQTDGNRTFFLKYAVKAGRNSRRQEL